jgi:UDP-N-acetyl-D-mannosaminuronic acid dehydrogenase
MQVSVLGLGYIGLPTAAMLAGAGHRVVGVDVNPQVLRNIAEGCGHIAELDVRALVKTALLSENFTVSNRLPDCSDAYIICVPTPTLAHRPDLRYVAQAAAEVASRAREGDLVIVESTVPPGTVENVLVRAFENIGKSANRVHIAHCPERVIPGAIVYELRHNSRVIGGRQPIDAQKAAALYASFCEGELCLTDCVTAELVKVVENTYRDVNLAFANELALLAENLDVDVWEVIRLANKHPRVQVLRPGPGVGGHCIPVDPTFLSQANPFVTELIQTARRVNERMPHVVVRLIDELLAGTGTGSKVALLGAAYKADVDDTRESPASEIARLLLEHRREVTIYDPLARAFAYALSPSIEDAVTGADALVLVTDHRSFRDLNPLRIGPLMRRRVLLDTRNILDRDGWSSAGFHVRTIGTASRLQADTAANTA